MSFLYNELKREAPQRKKAPTGAGRREIPIQSLNKLGCSICPRDKEEAKLRTPKMRPTGAKNPSIYLLGTGPNIDEDDSGEHWTGPAGDLILSKWTKSFVRNEVRFGHLTQCMPPEAPDGKRDLAVGVVELECCRPRVVRDIEESKPRVIIGVGDIPLRWATGMEGKANALTFRGRFFTVKIGTHVCLYMPIIWPNFINKKKQYNKSEYELAIEHDLALVETLLYNGELPTPEYHGGGYDRGIELITGQEAGDFQRLERGLADLASLRRTALDIETNGLRVYNLKEPKIWTAAVGTFERTIAFAMDHPDGWGSQSRISKVWELFGEFLLFSNQKTAHNLAMELEWLHFFYGPQILRLTDWNDTMSMGHTVDERPGTKSLEVQTIIHYGFNLKAQSRVDVSRPNWIEEFPIKEVLRYNGMDSKWTNKLEDTYDQILGEMDPSQLAEHRRKVELAPTLVAMEARGVPIDPQYAAKLEAKISGQLREIEDKLRRCPEIRQFNARFGTFSPTNSDHALKLMKDLLQREECRREDRDGKVSWSSDEEALAAIPKNEVPSAALILQHRGLEKLSTNYLVPIRERRIVSVDGRLHSKYSSMKAVTGRLAAEDPAVQNWPVRKHREIRGCVVAERGGWILAADYGQIEARVFGMASEDEALVRYLWTSYDIHGHWAGRMVDLYGPVKDWIVEEFGVDWDEKGPKTLRQEAKNKWVFPMFFGSSAKSCAEQLHLPIEVAEELMAEFWDEFRGVKRWQEYLMKFFEKNLYVETLTGRRRRGPMTKNELLNMPIQGTALDIVGAGMNALSIRAYEEGDDELQQVLQVHDDDTFLISDATIEQKMPIIAHELCMHRFDFINVPLLIEMKAGERWSELKELANYRSDELFNIRNPFK